LFSGVAWGSRRTAAFTVWALIWARSRVKWKEDQSENSAGPWTCTKTTTYFRRCEQWAHKTCPYVATGGLTWRSAKSIGLIDVSLLTYDYCLEWRTSM
jgi:hypothetical protein